MSNEIDSELVNILAEDINDLHHLIDDLVCSDFENDEEFQHAFHLAKEGALLLSKFIVQKQLQALKNKIEAQ